MTHPALQKLLRLTLRSLIGLLFSGIVLMGVYLLFVYHYAYSKGESVGYVQKISYKGWVCKTWEGEQLRALAVMPTIPEKFLFTVRDDAVVDQINAHLGQKVVLVYEQHIGLPGCFGDTQHFVVGVKPMPGE